jgi:uroporphyrinogen decarboxylase
MNSLQRTMSAIGHKEGDRVPLFLLLSMYGAKELQIPIKEYFSSARSVIQAQIRMKEKFRNDCYYTFYYAPAEIEAWHGEVLFPDDGPPNTGEPFISSLKQIDSLEIPDINDIPVLQRVLAATAGLKQKAGDETPIIGVVMSPFSLPVMQMGFERYLQILYNDRPRFHKLMQINAEFCVSWANAQLKAGATAICYFNPLASPSIIDRELYLKTGYPIDSNTIGRIKGPTATHLASGISLPVIDDLIKTGTSVLGFSAFDNLTEIKAAAAGRICLLGNLNALEMVRWTPQMVESKIRRLIAGAGMGGGLIISDNHGEIPWQLPDEVLLQIGESVRKWGEYPLKWVSEHEKA